MWEEYALGTESLWYLREDAYFEPLFNGWFAWPHLLSPATAARHVVKTHRRIMASFVHNAHLHVLALKDKRMLGSEFLNCREEDVPAIKVLLGEMESKCKELFSLSAAIDALDDMLRSHTSGLTLEPLYQRIPEPLRGYVELFFDIEHRASYRLLEALLYKSHYYDEALQSISLGLLSRVRRRPFVLSTPRLADENHIQINVNFRNHQIDTISRARESPLTGEEVRGLFADCETTTNGMEITELFTTSAPVRRYEPVKEGVRVRYLGHAGFILETQAVSVVIDPVMANCVPNATLDVFSYSQMPPRIDFVCLTHNHQDHVHLESLLQLRYKIGSVLVPKNNGGTLADPSIRLMLKQIGFQVFEYEDLDELQIPDGRVVSIPFLGEHGDLNVRSKTAWYVELLGRKFLFAADSSNLDNKMYERLGQLFPHLDVLALGMECVGAPYTWLYGALYSQKIAKAVKESRRLSGSNFEQAFPMVRAFDPKQLYVYAMGMEPWYEYFMGIAYGEDSKQLAEAKKLIDACATIDVKAEILFGSKSVAYSALT